MVTILNSNLLKRTGSNIYNICSAKALFSIIQNYSFERYFLFFHSYFARVKLLLNRQTGEAVAMKMVDTRKHPDASASVKKEVCIQKFLQHPHILRYFGTRRQNEIEYIFLEYAAGGELFDRIGIVFFLRVVVFEQI